MRDSQVVLVVKNLPANAGDRRDAGSILGSGRSPGGGHGNPLQHSRLENPRDRGAWQVAVQGATKSQTWLKRLSIYAQKHRYRNISFYCSLLCFEYNALKKKKASGRFGANLHWSSQCQHFFNSIGSFPIMVSHTGNSCNISIFFTVIFSIMKFISLIM